MYEETVINTNVANLRKLRLARFKAGFQLREILRRRKFSLSFFSIVSDHAELMFKIQKKPCEIFRQRKVLPLIHSAYLTPPNLILYRHFTCEVMKQASSLNMCATIIHDDRT